MSSLLHLCVIFAMTFHLFHSSEALVRNYIALTSDVHKFYQTSSVFFIFSQYNRHLEEYTVVQLLSREFSRKGILTLICNFFELGERVTMYRKRITRPLIGVLLKSKHDIDDFNLNIRKTNKSYPIWLVMFDGQSGDEICSYCNSTIPNIFELRFDTEMLVMCCEDDILNEWWSNTENRTERAAFASWSEERGLKLLAAEGLYARRNNVNGAGLRIAIVPKSSSLVIDYGHNTVGGFFGEILQELNRGMNFTITATLREKTFGVWSSTKKNWSGVVGQLVKKNADFGVAEFTMTSRRLDAIDFTLPFLTIKSRLFIKKPGGSTVKWSAYFEAFTVGIWLVILIILITTPILLALIQVKGDWKSISPIIFRNYLYILGIFCMQGLCEFPSESPLRIGYFSIFISALVVSSSYSASLTSFLAVSSATLPFNSLVGFVKDGSYKLIVYQGSSDYDFFATSTDPFLIKMKTFMKPWAELPATIEDGWHQVCQERVALFTNQAMKETKNARIKCDVSEIETGRLDSLAMTMTAGNQYTEVMNYHIQRFHDNGMLNRLKQKHFIKHTHQKTAYEVVSISGVVPVLSVLACGMVLAIFFLFCERMCFEYLKSRSLRRGSDRRGIPSRCVNFREKKKSSEENLQWRIDLFGKSNAECRP